MVDGNRGAGVVRAIPRWQDASRSQRDKRLTDWIASSVFNEIAALLVLAAGVGIIGVLLRQPLIVSFIAVGIAAGPSGLGIARSTEPIHLLAELGVAILLFLVGIKLDVKLVRTLGPVSLATGLGQVAFTSIVGFLLCITLGLDKLTSVYVAVALTFSSTIIIVKLLSDKREIDALHGRIALGFLIVQDLVVVLAMIVLSAVGIGGREGASAADIGVIFAAGLGIIGLVLIFIRYVADPLTERLARAPELLIAFAIALAALFAALGTAFGFGKELGGLLAGVALASTPYRDAIAARLSPLRDFLLLFFFISLGASLDIGNLGRSSIEAVILSLFVLVGNPLIVVAIMGALGYRRRTGFLAGLTVAQISEFSLIFMAMGVSLGHVSTEALGLVTLVGLITIAASTYMITYSHQLFRLCDPYLRIFERKANGGRTMKDEAEVTSCQFIVFGIGRYGGTVGRRLVAEGKSVLGVDFSPEAVQRWQNDGLLAIYGDASDPEFLLGLPLKQAQWVVLTIPDTDAGVSRHDTGLAFIQALRDAGFTGRIAISTGRADDIGRLEAAGVDLVLDPYFDAADRAVELLLTQRLSGRSAPEPENQRQL
jgi:Kef-type K+ transport system membrane component KefB